MNPESKQQDALLAEILGFDPNTGQRLTRENQAPIEEFDIVEQTVGFSLVTGEKIFETSQQDVPRPVRDAFERRMLGLANQINATLIDSGKLFKAENKLSTVIRSYHYYNPKVSASKQDFPVTKTLTFEKIASPNPVRTSGNRLKSIGIYGHEDNTSTEITFNKDGTNTIFLQLDSNTEIRIVYHSGALSLCTRHEDGKNVLTYDFPRAESHEITTKYSKITLPHYPKAVDYESEILNNPRLLSDPFESRTAEDTNWLGKSGDILSVFGIVVKS